MNCDRVREVASGFVLGALDPDEMIAVSDHLDTCSQPHPEVEDFGGVLPYIAESLEPIEPPAWLRESVIAAAQADLVTRRRALEPGPGVTQPVAVSTSGPRTASAANASAEPISLARVRASRRRQAMTWATRVAAAVAVVVLAGYAVVLQGDLNKAKVAQAEDAKVNYIWTQAGTLKAVLTPIDGSSASGMAALRPTGHIIVRLHGLPATAGDQVYAVWLTRDSGTPSKVGWFTVDDSGGGYLEVDNVPSATSLWLFVCLEPNSGVMKPTGPQIVAGTFSL
jgi:hypothetical protein